MNWGHVVVWGALVADRLTTGRRRYTAMTPDNIVFMPSENRVGVVGGASGILPIAWPSEARLHHADIALFRRGFGSGLTAALRLGYTYRLGPIGEWIFFEPEDRSVVVGPPRGYWLQEWDAPQAELDLGNDCQLDDDAADRITEMGGSYRGHGDFVASKRCFMRCYLATLATKNEKAMAVALINLAGTYLAERRWCRVLALGYIAALLSGALREEARDLLISLLDEARRHDPTASGRMMSFVTDRVRGIDFTEVLWRLEDLAIQEELAQGT